MFDTLNDRLSEVFDRLTGRGVLSEKDVDEALREVRVALLEADVALPVVEDFIAKAKERAPGEEIIRSVKPADQVVKIVYDGLVEMLGGEEPEALNLDADAAGGDPDGRPAGLGQDHHLGQAGAAAIQRMERKKVMMASLDTRRPAAMEQLAVLAKQAEVDTLPIVRRPGARPTSPGARCRRRSCGGFDVLILDTAGRTTLDEAMMAEAAEIARIATPAETLLVADSLTGQDAVRTARAFHERLPLTGLILTRADGDARGGAVLSMRAVTGLPIKFLGAGEKIDALDVFDARRVAGRILGHGDVVALVEKAAAELDQAKAERMAKKLAKGKFDLDDLLDQLGQMRKMGGHAGHHGPSARRAEDEEADRRGRALGQDDQAPGGDHPVHDPRGAPQARPAQRLAQAPHRGRRRRRGGRDQPAAETAPPDGRRLQDDEPRRRQGPGADGRDDGPGRPGRRHAARNGRSRRHAAGAGRRPREAEGAGRRQASRRPAQASAAPNMPGLPGGFPGFPGGKPKK